MKKEDKLVLGTLAGVNLILSPEHYEEYKGTLNKQLEEKDKEIERLQNIINELEQENSRLKEMLIQNGSKQKMLLEDINKYAIGVIDNYLKEK